MAARSDVAGTPRADTITETVPSFGAGRDSLLGDAETAGDVLPGPAKLSRLLDLQQLRTADTLRDRSWWTTQPVRVP
jgi:hypothetical protein